MASIGPTELILVGVIAVVVLAVPVALVITVVMLVRNKNG